jgi:hypothetical protein
LLAPGGSREDTFEIAKGRLFLVEAKRQGFEQTFTHYIPEAVGQAIALLKSAKYVSLAYFTSPSEKIAFQPSRSSFLSI